MTEEQKQVPLKKIPMARVSIAKHESQFISPEEVESFLEDEKPKRMFFARPTLTRSLTAQSVDKSALFLWTRAHHTWKQRFCICLSECLGTAIFVFIGCAGCIPGKNGQLQDTEMIALNFGFAFMVSQMLFSHISMGHFNPALTLSAVIMKKLSWEEAPLYFIGQFFGAFLGYGIIYYISFDPVDVMGIGVCSPLISNQIKNWQAFLCEFLISLILCAYCCVVWEQYKNWQDSLALTFGVVYIALTMAAVSYTGAHMNPFRSLAPAAVNMFWKDHWVYWAGPFAGSIVASGSFRLYRHIRDRLTNPLILF